MRTEDQAIRGLSPRHRRLSVTAGGRPSLPAPPFLVAGLGRAGAAAISALRGLVAPDLLYCWDASTAAPVRRFAKELCAAGIRTWLGAPPALEGPLRSCTIVKSPGVPFAAPLLQRAQEHGLVVLDELELGWRLSRAPIVAVTGTNGKSTVCTLLAAIANAAGVNVALAGNSEFAPPLSSVAAGLAELIVCEVSSFQLEGATEFLPDAAILTNVRREHLNRHGTIDAYVACKRRLFIRGEVVAPLAVLNLDDDRGVQFASEIRARGGTPIGYGRARDAEFRLRRCGWSLRSGWIEVDTPDGSLALRTALPGAHNAANVLGALAAARALGLELEVSAAAIERTPGVPGRFERIDEGQPFDVVVDFAHTPDAVGAVVETARAVVSRRPGARLHVLVSVSGHRSPDLSAPMGEAAARLADRVLVTEGSSFGRPRDQMLAPLIEGARAGNPAGVEVVPNRRTAIRRVLAGAAAGDVVLVLGRGAIPRLSRQPNSVGVAFDDRSVVRDELEALIEGPSRGPGAARIRSPRRAPRRSGETGH